MVNRRTGQDETIHRRVGKPLMYLSPWFLSTKREGPAENGAEGCVANDEEAACGCENDWQKLKFVSRYEHRMLAVDDDFLAETFKDHSML